MREKFVWKQQRGLYSLLRPALNCILTASSTITRPRSTKPMEFIPHDCCSCLKATICKGQLRCRQQLMRCVQQGVNNTSQQANRHRRPVAETPHQPHHHTKPDEELHRTELDMIETLGAKSRANTRCWIERELLT